MLPYFYGFHITSSYLSGIDIPGEFFLSGFKQHFG
jgi:hypothetical protein